MGVSVSKPAAAYTSLLVGGILIVVHSALIMLANTPWSGILEQLSVTEEFYKTRSLVEEFIEIPPLAKGIMGLVLGILVLGGFGLVLGGAPRKVKVGGVLGVVFGVLSFLVAGGGFIVGFILALIGGALGLMWKPPIHSSP